MAKLRGNPWAVLAIRNGTGGPAALPASADSGQMAGAISSPGSSENSPDS